MAPRAPALIAPPGVSRPRRIILSETENDEKHELTRARALALGYFAIGWGLACWFWPADLGSSGAILHALASGVIGVAATVLAGMLWK